MNSKPKFDLRTTNVPKKLNFRSDVERRLFATGIMHDMEYESETFRVSLTYKPDFIDRKNMVIYEVKKFIDPVSQRTLVAMVEAIKTVYTQWKFFVLVECSRKHIETHEEWRWEHIQYSGSGKLSGREAVIWLRARGVRVIPYNPKDLSLWYAHRKKIGAE